MQVSDAQRYAGIVGSGPSEHDSQIIEASIREFGNMQLWRATTAAHWEEVAELILPTSRNTFYYGNFNWPGMKKTDRQIDSTGALALNRFAAICNSLLTPKNMFWHDLRASDPYVMKDRDTRIWFDSVKHVLFKTRYAPVGNFSAQNNNLYMSLGAFGNGAMFVDRCDPRFGQGLRYRQIPMGELFFHENHQGLVDGFCRWFKLTARQAHQKWPDAPLLGLEAAKEQNSEYPYDFLHRVCFREDYDPQRLDFRGMPYASYYISLSTKELMEEGGFHTFPTAISRYEQTPNEVYGRSPAMMVLPALKTLNAEKATFLKQGHRAVDPVLLTQDDGLTDFSLRPGAMNKGGMNADGKALVGVLPVGNINTSKEMMDEERALINDAFLVSLFQILKDSPNKTARQVIEEVNEKGILLAPTVGRQEDEYLGNLIPRELDLLAQMHLLPPMPPRLKEAKGEYTIVFTSPLAKAMKMQEVAGFMRSVEMAQGIAQATGDTSVLDPFDFEIAIPEIAAAQQVPERWMASPEKIQGKAKARAQAQKDQQTIQALPAQAAMMKAQAISQKAQGGQPQPQPQGQPQPPATAPGVQNAQPPIPMGPNEVQL